ncbi:hypothetical protein [Microcystis phage Mae-JY22]
MEGDEIEIPDQVVVRCPLRRFELRRALRCETCAHFAGLTEVLQRSHGDKAVAFHDAYRVRCTFPIDRELQTLATEVD